MAVLNNSNAITTSGSYDINNSLRFRASASAYLNRTPASAGTRTTWTWSGWVKRGASDGANAQMLFGVNTGAGTYSEIRTLGDKFCFQDNNLGATEFSTNAVLRDFSAWYHLMLVLDTTQATSTNRVKAYINGVEQTFAAGSYPTQNSTLSMNTANAHNIGRRPTGVSYFDGYLAEVNFIDGSAKTPSDFGETDTTTGVWKPKAYTGTYGTNGFYIKFSDIATTSGSNAGLGKDFSGNTNYWTTNNISVTAGSTYDAMTDSPTLTSATVANYCVLNPVETNYGTISQGNLNASLAVTGTTGKQARGTFLLPSSGKYYFEVIPSALGVGAQIGIAKFSSATNGGNGISPAFSVGDIYVYLSSGQKQDGVNIASYGSSFTTSDVIGVALDVDNGTIAFYKNNVSQGTAYSSLTLSNYYPAVHASGATGTFTCDVNFGQRPFSYTPPTGFVALNTYNLPDSTIKKGNTVMDAYIYTGDGNSTRTITLPIVADFVWSKNRTTANDHVLIDTVRGGTSPVKALISNSTGAELTTTGDWGGFGYPDSLSGTSYAVVKGTQATSYTNKLNDSYVNWIWQAGQGSTSSNTSGSITSTVSVNTTAGFSVVTFTGNGVNSTVGHGLGVAPRMIIEKERSAASNWATYHASLGATKTVYLNLTNAEETQTAFWNSTAPTSTVFSLGTDGDTNSNGVTYVAYCWAEIAGFSKFGSYTGNGSADGPFVYLGFRPKYVLVKASSSVEAWYINDSARDTYNPDLRILAPNLADAEFNNGSTWMDLTSNGFKIRYNTAPFNTNAATYIYMAFAENPFKNALAR